jgi:peptidoglycan biosynthesis protein MviN/MurJ (putative lipid II flippase)
MVLVWAIFTLMLFVLEPFVLHRSLSARAERDLPGTLRRIAILHWFLLVLSLATVAGAVAGSHGAFLF